MDHLKTAARFFAFTYYLNSKGSQPSSPQKAGRYARGNWKRFVPYVQGGKFLTTLVETTGEQAPTAKSR